MAGSRALSPRSPVGKGHLRRDAVHLRSMEPLDLAGAEATRALSAEEAERWIRDVGGALVRKAAPRDGGERWLALVRTPAAPAARSRLIVGLGETPAAATRMAQMAWNEIWKTLSGSH